MSLTARVATVLALLVPLLLVAPRAAPAAGPDAILYELVENITQETPRISEWAAQGTAVPGSPFCPQPLIDSLAPGALITAKPSSCTITVLNGTDTVAGLGGTVSATIGTMINADNPVDAPESVAMTGDVTGDLQVVPFFPPPFGVLPDLNEKKATLGPVVPIIRVVNGKYVPNPPPDVILPSLSCFTATFRLPFRVTSAGKPDRPVRGKQAFYLADDGSLIKVQPEEFALGFPILRAEVTFVSCP